MPDKPIFDPEVTAAIKNFFVDNKGKFPTYKHSYFNEKYGERAKEIIDEVVSTRKAIRIMVEKDYTIHALRQQWYEGTRYLRKHLDTTDHKYTQLLAFIKCRTEYDYIEIAPRPALRGALIDAKGVLDTAWREDLIEWMDSNPPEMAKFPPENKYKELALSAADIEWANNQFVGVEKLFYWLFERDKITVVRYTHDV